MDVALVVGSARGVWEDLRAVSALLVERPIILAVNAMVAFLPWMIDHAVSHHGRALAHLVGYRRLIKSLEPAVRDAPLVAHSSYATAGVDRAWPEFTAGDSSLLATRIACALGFPRIVLVGVPLEDTGRFYDDAERPSFAYAATYRPRWQEARAELADRVRSMSGWTAELLGRP